MYCTETQKFHYKLTDTIVHTYYNCRSNNVLIADLIMFWSSEDILVHKNIFGRFRDIEFNPEYEQKMKFVFNKHISTSWNRPFDARSSSFAQKNAPTAFVVTQMFLTLWHFEQLIKIQVQIFTLNLEVIADCYHPWLVGRHLATFIVFRSLHYE